MSGLGLAEEARRLVHLVPPKKEEELAEHVEMWQDKMRRLEAHGDVYKLAPEFKIDSLRMLMTGISRSTLIHGGRTGTMRTLRSLTRSC